MFLIPTICFALFLTISAQVPLNVSSNVCQLSKKTLHTGTQNQAGSCSTTPMGEVPSTDRMVSVVWKTPKDGDILGANKPFTAKITVSNLETGFFADPAINYNFFPQTLNANGAIRGHVHITIQQLSGVNFDNVPDPKNVTFFQGLNFAASPAGDMDLPITAGLPAGRYRLCTMTSSFSHQPTIMPVARRGAQDDCIRVTVLDGFCPTVVTAQPGETLNSIALREQVPVGAIIIANQLIFSFVPPGTRLTVPKPCVGAVISRQEADDTFSLSENSSDSFSTGAIVGIVLAGSFILLLATFFSVRYYYTRKTGFSDLEMNNQPKL